VGQCVAKHAQISWLVSPPTSDQLAGNTSTEFIMSAVWARSGEIRGNKLVWSVRSSQTLQNLSNFNVNYSFPTFYNISNSNFLDCEKTSTCRAGTASLQSWVCITFFGIGVHSGPSAVTILAACGGVLTSRLSQRDPD
jgi:hypothetical protein